MAVEQWTHEGTTYDVSANGKDQFLEDHPEATQQVEQWVDAVSYTHLTLPTNREV